MNHFGGIIYALRKSRYLTQEQLAEQLSVSSVTISKWERNETMPSLELLCKLADYFAVSVDELLGRKQRSLQFISQYTEEKLSDFELGLKLLEYCELARREGYLALEPAILKDKPDAFLEFAITYVLDALRQGIKPEQIVECLKNYAEAEPDWQSKKSRYNMQIAVLMSILAGENPELLKELIASYLGKDLRGKFMRNEENKLTGEEILEYYKTKAYVVPLLEELAVVDDNVLRATIRNIDNVTLATSLSGASGTICIRFLRNLSDRLLYFMHEDIQAVQAENNDIREAQRLVLELVKQH